MIGILGGITYVGVAKACYILQFDDPVDALPIHGVKTLNFIFIRVVDSLGQFSQDCSVLKMVLFMASEVIN